MSVFLTLVQQELLRLWRGRTFQVLLLVLGALAAVAISSSGVRHQEVNQEHQHLTDTARHLFEHQKETTAHMAGHYGHVVFRPPFFIQAIDPGIIPFTGTTIRIEAHTQHEPVFSTTSGQSSLVRFGSFTFILLLQTVVPLLILFTCYRNMLDDRLNRTLMLVISQGVSLRKLIMAKVTACSLIYILFLVLSAFAFGLVFFVHSEAIIDISRLSSLLGVYAVYYTLLVGITTYLSARVLNASGLLASLLAIWFICTIIIPKAAAGAGEQLYPLPTRFEIAEQVRSKKKDGINGHDRNNLHTKHFIDSVLQVHGVTHPDDLPFKIGGLLMQADEDFNNLVYDQTLDSVNNLMLLQGHVGSLLSFVDPFLAVRNLSSAMAATDLYHDIHFAKHVEGYRRDLIKGLNEQDGMRHSEFKNENNRLMRNYWQQVPPHQYELPSIWWGMERTMIELIALMLWFLGIFSLIYFTAKKITIV